MVKQGMHRPTDEFIGFTPKQLCRRRIDECRLAFHIQTINTFTGGMQDQFVLTLKLLRIALERFVDAKMLYADGHVVGDRQE
jgi:hypothetical protein